MWSGLERGMELELESFSNRRRQDDEASQCGIEDRGSGGSKRSAGEGFVGRRPSLDRLPWTAGAPMESEA